MDEGPLDETEHGDSDIFVDPHMKGGRDLIRRYKCDTQCWLPGFVTEVVLKQTTAFPVDESDIFAVSFPKSGT